MLILMLNLDGGFVHVNILQGKREATFPDFFFFLVTAAPLFEVAGFVTLVTWSTGVSLWVVINNR